MTASLAIVLGLILGGLPARSEIRAVRAEVRRLEKRDCGVGGDLASMFGARPMIGAARPAEPQAQPAPAPAPPTDAGAAVGLKVEVHRSADDIHGRAEGPRNELRLMREGLDLRRTQARAALMEEANPEPEQLRTFDASIEEMNHELRDLAQVFVRDIAGSGEEPSRHELMVFAADTLDVLITAGDAMRGSFSEEQRGALTEESIDPFSYVDPDIVDLLAELDR